MGTAFLTCPESAIGTAYREALTHAQATDTRTTRIFGLAARGIVNRMMQALQADEATVPPSTRAERADRRVARAAAQAGQADCLSLWAGQGGPGAAHASGAAGGVVGPGVAAGHRAAWQLPYRPPIIIIL